MKKLFFFVVAPVIVFILVRIMTRPKLKFFKAAEFGLWWPMMSAELLRKLDRFRELWGAPVVVSTAHGGIGRFIDKGKDGENSQHNVTRWGEVRAVDFFPMVQTGNGYRYMQTADDLARAYQVAVEAGFSGIGLYTDTSPGYMVHGDVRQDKSAGTPALWSRVNGQYLDINRVLV